MPAEVQRIFAFEHWRYAFDKVYKLLPPAEVALDQKMSVPVLVLQFEQLARGDFTGSFRRTTADL